MAVVFLGKKGTRAKQGREESLQHEGGPQHPKGRCNLGANVGKLRSDDYTQRMHGKDDANS
jgi:hypothetical protein